MGVAGIYYGSLAIDTMIVLWTMLMAKKEFHLLRQKATNTWRISLQRIV